MMNPFLQVAIGGAVGATARYSVYRLAAWQGAGAPVATAAVNIVGSFLMGLAVALMAHRLGNHHAPLLATGILGGFTTFSAFSLDVLTLWQRGQAGAALVYVLATVVLSLTGIVAGLALGRGLWA